MLLIPCPYCGDDRPELEFRYAGEAHIARPARPVAARRRGVGGLSSSSAPTRKGLHVERWRHVHGCGRFFNAVRDTVSDRFVADLQGRRAEARPRRSLTAEAAPMSRLPPRRAAAAIDRAQAARASPSTARPTTGFAGDTLASALLANGVHLVGRSFKYHRPRGILAAGAEEPNALVDRRARRGALRRRTCAPRRSSSTTACRATARTAGRRSPSTSARSTTCSRRCSRPASTTRPSCGRERFWDSGLRAVHPRAPPASARAPDAARSRPLRAAATPIATCWSSAPARPASPRRSPRPKPARASSCATSRRSSAARCCREPTPTIDGQPALDWLARRRRRARRDARTSRCCRAPRRSATTHQNFVGLAERVTDHLADARRRRCRASGCGRCAPSEVVLATGAHRAAAGLRRTTTGPASCWPAPRAPISTATASRPATRAVRRHRARQRLSRRASTSPQAGVEVAAIVDLRAERRPRRSPAARRAAGIEVLRRPHRHRHAAAGCASPRVARRPARADGERRRRRATIACDARADVRRLDARRPPVLAVARQARLTTTLQAFVPGPVGRRPSARPAPAAAAVGLAGALADGAAAGARRPRDAGCDGRRPQPHAVDATAAGAGGTLRRCRPTATPARPRPSSTSRTTSPPRTSRLAVREGFQSIEHVKRYTTTGMATDQGKTSNINGLAIAADALGKPIPQVGPHHLPPALHAGRPSAPSPATHRGDAVRSRPHDADRTTGPRRTARCSRTSACGSAPGTSRRPARTCTPRSPRMPRRARGASACSTPRRSARSRSSGPDAAEFLNRIYTNAWTKLGAGPLPLRPDAAARTASSSTTASSAASAPTASM